MEKGRERERERCSAARQIRTSPPSLFTSNTELQGRLKTLIDGSSYKTIDCINYGQVKPV